MPSHIHPASFYEEDPFLVRPDRDSSRMHGDLEWDLDPFDSPTSAPEPPTNTAVAAASAAHMVHAHHLALARTQAASTPFQSAWTVGGLATISAAPAQPATTSGQAALGGPAPDRVERSIFTDEAQGYADPDRAAELAPALARLQLQPDRGDGHYVEGHQLGVGTMDARIHDMSQDPARVFRPLPRRSIHQHQRSSTVPRNTTAFQAMVNRFSVQSQADPHHACSPLGAAEASRAALESGVAPISGLELVRTGAHPDHMQPFRQFRDHQAMQHGAGSVLGRRGRAEAAVWGEGWDDDGERDMGARRRRFDLTDVRQEVSVAEFPLDSQMQAHCHHWW